MNPFLLLLKRIGQWFIDLGERLSDSTPQCERQGTLKIQHSAPEAATDDDQIEGLPATAPSFEIQGLTERVNSKSLEAMKVETLHLLFAMHAAHLLGSEVHQARKVGLVLESIQRPRSVSNDKMQSLNQNGAIWNRDAGAIDALICLLRDIPMPDTPIADAIDLRSEEREMADKLLDAFEDNFNKQLLENTLRRS